MNIFHRPYLSCYVFAAVIVVSSATAAAQVIRAPLDSGFARTTSVQISVDEMLGSQKSRPVGQPIFGPGYPALWAAEVQYKPVRFVRMEVTDPKTGQAKEELIWYMIYRYLQRDYTEIAGTQRDALVANLEDEDGRPANSVEENLSTPIIVPRFQLQTNDEGPQQVFKDVVLPEVQQKILKREMRSNTASHKLFNSVEVIQEVGPQVSVLDEDPLDKAVYGVAIWRNVDPDTDYFTVRMTGFTNAYQIQQQGSITVIRDKVVEQRFGRPGDRYNQEEAEFRVIGEPRWLYVDRPQPVTIKSFQQVLRNIDSQTSFEDGQ